MAQDHTNKQFDTEMEAIRSGVLSMGGMVEKQLTRAIDARRPLRIQRRPRNQLLRGQLCLPLVQLLGFLKRRIGGRQRGRIR